MITVVVYERETRQILAAIPLSENGETGFCRNDVECEIFNDTEPVITETEDGPILKKDSFIINLGGSEDAEKE